MVVILGGNACAITFFGQYYRFTLNGWMVGKELFGQKLVDLNVYSYLEKFANLMVHLTIEV